MKGICSCYDDCFNLRILQHCRVIMEGHAGLMNGCHSSHEILGHVANCIKLSVSGFATSVQMGKLCDGATTEDSHPQQARFFLHKTVFPEELQGKSFPSSRK